MDFDPSRGVNGYSSEEYHILLSRYTAGRVRFSTNGENYRRLAQRALVAAQRWAHIPFAETVELPQIARPLPRYQHYIPGQDYSLEEYDAFYRHYGVKTKGELAQTHVRFEALYGLDPSFLLTVRWLRTSAPPQVIAQLCYLFNEATPSALFRHRYQVQLEELDPDVELSILLQEPERYLTQKRITTVTVPISITPPVLPRAGEQLYTRLLARARSRGLDTHDKSILELYSELGESLPSALQDYVDVLSSWPIVPDESPVTILLESTNALSDERYQALSAVPTYTLERYITRHGIPATDPLTGASKRADLLTALMLLGGNSVEELPTLAIDYARLDLGSDNAYTQEELVVLVRLYGLQPSTRIDMVNNLYLLLWLPNFFRPGPEVDCPTADGSSVRDVSPNERYAYGIPGQNYLCYTRDELLTAFRQRRVLADPRDPRITFPSYATAYLEYLTRKDQELRQVVSQLRHQQPSIPQSLLENLPLIPVELLTTGTVRRTSYSELVRQVFQALYRLAQYYRGWHGPGTPYPPGGTAPANLTQREAQQLLAEFYHVCEMLPSLLANTLLSLRVPQSQETIADLYQYLWNGQYTPRVVQRILTTAEYYLK